MHTAILNNIEKHVHLTQEEQDYFTSLLKPIALKKKEILLRQGELSKYIYFVVSGVLRAFYPDKDQNENIIMFAVKDWWVTDMNSFLKGHPAMLSIDAVENSSIFALRKENLDLLFETLPVFERFFRIIMQNAYIREQIRVIDNLSLTAEERYLKFLDKYPQVVQQITQKQIASYLGITPEFLSAIRRKIALS